MLCSVARMRRDSTPLEILALCACTAPRLRYFSRFSVSVVEEGLRHGQLLRMGRMSSAAFAKF
jgi:hypothetical protein